MVIQVQRETLAQLEIQVQLVQPEQLHQLVEQLCDREREVLQMRFGLDGRKVMTLEEVGEAVGCTRERVRQIQNKAIKKLQYLHTDAPPQNLKKLSEDDTEE